MDGRTDYGVPSALSSDADRDPNILPPTLIKPIGQPMKKIKLKTCGFGCGRMVYKDALTGNWMEDGGIVSHTITRCRELRKEKEKK